MAEYDEDNDFSKDGYVQATYDDIKPGAMVSRFSYSNDDYSNYEVKEIIPIEATTSRPNPKNNRFRFKIMFKDNNETQVCIKNTDTGLVSICLLNGEHPLLIKSLGNVGGRGRRRKKQRTKQRTKQIKKQIKKQRTKQIKKQRTKQRTKRSTKRSRKNSNRYSRSNK